MDRKTDDAIDGRDEVAMIYLAHAYTALQLYQPTDRNHVFCCHPSSIGSMSVNPNSGQ